MYGSKYNDITYVNKVKLAVRINMMRYIVKSVTEI